MGARSFLVRWLCLWGMTAGPRKDETGGRVEGRSSGSGGGVSERFLGNGVICACLYFWGMRIILRCMRLQVGRSLYPHGHVGAVRSGVVEGLFAFKYYSLGVFVVRMALSCPSHLVRPRSMSTVVKLTATQAIMSCRWLVISLLNEAWSGAELRGTHRLNMTGRRGARPKHYGMRF